MIYQCRFVPSLFARHNKNRDPDEGLMALVADNSNSMSYYQIINLFPCNSKWEETRWEETRWGWSLFSNKLFHSKYVMIYLMMNVS